MYRHTRTKIIHCFSVRILKPIFCGVIDNLKEREKKKNVSKINAIFSSNDSDTSEFPFILGASDYDLSLRLLRVSNKAFCFCSLFMITILLLTQLDLYMLGLVIHERQIFMVILLTKNSFFHFE